MDKPISLVDQAYEEIKNMVCNFELFPGQIVSDFTLSKAMGMSRTPIRQALQRLEGDGLIEDAGAGKSYQVSRITEEEIVDLFDAREGIEVMAVKLAVDKGIPEPRLVELERISNNMEEANLAGNIRENFNYDQEFHDYLVNMSGNKKLIRFHESLLIQLRRVRMLSYLERKYQDKAFQDHKRVLDGLRAGDKELASEALARHIETAKRDYLRVVNDAGIMGGLGVLRFFSGQEK